ncbi:MAG TPA: sigma-54 dependent transcriptional regulator [Myxococcota bacterium]|jgi:DNA-binding NtrC family response regulator|nr:sigma-54 dependent transcriptional regulator [Myxococcota bacterium]
MPCVLVVDDEPGVRESLRMLLKGECDVVVAGSVDQALDVLARTPVDLILLDLVLPGRSGLSLLPELAERGPLPPVVVLSATRTVATAVEAMKLGAADYVTKPFEPGALRIKLQRLLAGRDLEREVLRLRDEIQRRTRLGHLVGRSDVMQEVFRTVERLAISKANVLITGESGTGKELVARALHELGPRSSGPFVALNCAAIPDTLIESELFGHERGAFTDARDRRIGRLEAAHGGTLFLDEVGELSGAVQAKLLRALQERSIERLGGTASVPIDVRFVAATNRELEREVAAGRFRSDLYYRIHVVGLALPPLRERREDIRLLCEEFLARAQVEAGRGPTRVSPSVLAAFERYSWPGNVRELENVIERAVALAEGDVLQLDDLPRNLVHSDRVGQLHEEVRRGQIGLEDAVGRFESALLLEALERSAWNQTRAAELLGITRRLLKLKMDRFGLQPQGPLVAATAVPVGALRPNEPSTSVPAGTTSESDSASPGSARWPGL